MLGQQSHHDPHCLQTRPYHLPHEPHDVFWVIISIRVGADAAAFVLFDLVLVNDPGEGAAVAFEAQVFLGHHSDRPKLSKMMIESKGRC